MINNVSSAYWLVGKSGSAITIGNLISPASKAFTADCRRSPPGHIEGETKDLPASLLFYNIISCLELHSIGLKIHLNPRSH
jgi:hypothetical protein